MTPHPALAQLGLDDDDLAALSRNGFVREEPHQRGKIFKLRFRVAGIQRVRSLGTDPARVGEIVLALQAWQRQRRVELQIRKVTKQVRRQLRESKLQLEPLLEAIGYKFHGRAIRRSKGNKVIREAGSFA